LFGHPPPTKAVKYIFTELTFSIERHTQLRSQRAHVNERQRMTTTRLILVLICLMTGTLMAQEVKVTPLMSKNLPDLPGKEGLMLLVEYPPGGADPIHRHDADAFVYVLEGTVIMQLKGGKEVTLTPGQTFYEGPDDVHVVGRNASKTKPAKFVVVLVKKDGAPALIPVR
jgi:quercetin dioxygenase-like cupin family protein